MRERGRKLGRLLADARAPRSAESVAREANVSVETLRKIERGATATPAFATIAAVSHVLGVDLQVLARKAGLLAPNPVRTAPGTRRARGRN